MKFTAKLMMGFVIGSIIGGVVGFYGALVGIPVEWTGGIIGPLTAAIVAATLLSK